MDDGARILVFQHVDVEHPGVFRDYLHERRIAWDAIELDAGEPIPDLGAYGALWVMGGPMDVWEEDRHPWLAAEKAAIREAVLERRLPFLGVCLGHQLLVDALGGEVAPGATPEIGILDVSVTEAGRASPFLQGLPATMACLQWHAAEVRRLPPGAEALMSSPACAVQAVSAGRRALGIQFHVEVTPSTISDWAAIPAYREALVRHLGADELPRFEAECRAAMATLNACARRLFDNWMRMAASPT